MSVLRRIQPLILLALAAAPGCIGRTSPATRPATAIDPRTADPAYWLSQPASAAATAGDLAVLWDASEDVARRYSFRIDRRDYRDGILTTYPIISKQFFEVWRGDAGSIDDVRESSLATVRRSIHFRFSEAPDGGYSVAPRVLVERQSRPDPTLRTDESAPDTYWYALRRDRQMERKLADDIRDRIASHSTGALAQP